MKGKVINHLKIFKLANKTNNYHLLCTKMTCVLMSVNGIAILPFTPISYSTVTASNTPTYTDERGQEAVESFSDKLIYNMKEVHKGKRDYEKYISSLSTHYGLPKNTIQLTIEENIQILLEQEDMEQAIPKLIEYHIKSGNLTPKKEQVKQKVRLTTYQYTPDGDDKQLGGSLGLIEPYLKEGSIHFDENGFAIWKGGSTSKLDGKVYGEEGKEYLIVATATEYLIGQYGFKYNSKIQYYDYNDTFKLEINTKNGTKKYDAIVLDSCGASMNWSTTANGKHAPETKSEKQYCDTTNNKKIDVFTAPKGFKDLTNPADVAYQYADTSAQSKVLKPLTKEAKAYMEQMKLNTSSATVRVKVLQ